MKLKHNKIQRHRREMRVWVNVHMIFQTYVTAGINWNECNGCSLFAATLLLSLSLYFFRHYFSNVEMKRHRGTELKRKWNPVTIYAQRLNDEADLVILFIFFITLMPSLLHSPFVYVYAGCDFFCQSAFAFHSTSNSVENKSNNELPFFLQILAALWQWRVRSTFFFPPSTVIFLEKQMEFFFPRWIKSTSMRSGKKW